MSHSLSLHIRGDAQTNCKVIHCSIEWKMSNKNNVLYFNVSYQMWLPRMMSFFKPEDLGWPGNAISGNLKVE